jgi:hypothetical protein
MHPAGRQIGTDAPIVTHAPIGGVSPESGWQTGTIWGGAIAPMARLTTRSATRF